MSDVAPLEVPEVAGRPCSIASALELIGDRWTLLIIREVRFGNRRFSQIARNTGAPRDRLAARLRDLVELGVLERREYQASPQRFDYHLTAAGRDLGPVLDALRGWGDRWAVDAPPLVVWHHDHPLRTELHCGTCAEKLRAADLRREVLAAGWDEHGPTG